MAKKIERKLHKIDADGKATGRLASQIAILLRGKNKPEFEPNIDGGDVVEVVNVKNMKFTGGKLEQKKYFRYSGYPGGLKSINLKEVVIKDPAAALRRAVKQMLPANRLRQSMIKRLIIK